MDTSNVGIRRKLTPLMLLVCRRRDMREMA